MRTLNKTLTYFFLLSAIVILNTSCKESSCPTCSNWNDFDNNNNIHGSGNKVSEERIVSFFNSINHATVGQVNISYGDVQEVIVTTDDNIQKYIKTKVENKKLSIYIESDSGLSNFKVTIDIILTELKSLVTSSAGNITSTNRFPADKVYLYLNSAGNINLDVDANELHSSLNSAGNLILKGKAEYHYSSVNSAGNLHGYNFETVATSINVNSAGNAFVNVSDQLDVTLTSMGSLYYIGHPQITQNISSLGRVINYN